MSTGGDAAAVGITWLSTHHPWAAASIVIVLLVAALLAARWIVRSIQGMWRRAVSDARSAVKPLFKPVTGRAHHRPGD